MVGFVTFNKVGLENEHLKRSASRFFNGKNREADLFCEFILWGALYPQRTVPFL